MDCNCNGFAYILSKGRQKKWSIETMILVWIDKNFQNLYSIFFYQISYVYDNRYGSLFNNGLMQG